MERKEIVKFAASLLDDLNNFLAMQTENGKIIIECTKQACEHLGNANLIAMCALSSAIIRKNLEPGNTSESISKRFVLSASFFQGVDLCQKSIMEGNYIQAAALLKQEMETIAAIEEAKSNVRTEKKVPNVKHVKWNLNILYGRLNKAAHVADSQLLNKLIQTDPIGNTAPASAVPLFNKDTAKGLYGLHVTLLIQLAIQLNDLYLEAYGEGLTDTELACIAEAFKLLLEDGWLVLDD
ncbi:MAG: hypothetical protein ACE5HY_00820 [Candidatus Hydrothermarchaeales archaeon]